MKRWFSRAPLLPLTAAFAGGIAVTDIAAWPAVDALRASLGCAVAAALAAAIGRTRLATALLLAALVALGAARAVIHPPPPEHVASRVPIASAADTLATVEGRLADEPIRWAPDRTRLLLDVDAVVEGDVRRPATGRVQVTAYGETVPLGHGQRIEAELRLHRPVGFRNPGAFDYPEHLRREGILVVASARGDRIRPLTPDAPPWPVRVKRWAVTAMGEHLPPSSAALLAGLVLGDRTGIPREMDEAFRRAGVYHVLAVSGFNVALLAASVFAVLALAGLPRRPTAITAALVLVAFALVVGAQPSVLRATIMGLALLVGILIDRESQLMNALALAGFAVLAWRPGDLWEPSFALSFAATAGIVHLAAPVAEGLVGAGCPRALGQALAVSLGAQAAVTPVMLAHFNQLSLAGVAVNLVVVPLSAAGTSLGLLALALAPASDVAAGAVFNFLWLVLVALRAIVWLAAKLPWAMIHLPAPGWPEALAWYAALALVPFLALHRGIRAAAGALALVAVALSVWPWIAPGDGRLRVVFLDVGQGDAAYVEVPGGPRLLVDAGPGGPRRFDVGERVVAPFLWNRPVGRLDVVAVSHSDPDHSGGVSAVMRGFRVGEIWENGRWEPGSEDALRAVTGAGIPRRMLAAGQRIAIGSAQLTVLNPGRAPGDPAREPTGDPTRENDASLVLRLDWNDVSFLFTGDVSWRAETDIVEGALPLRADVLKVAHHGSRFGSSAPFLDAAGPRVAVVSAGARNPFRHPTPEALARLRAAGARVYRTDRDGAVIVESDGRTLWVTRWARGITDRYELATDSRADAARAGELPRSETPRPPGSPEAVMGRAGSGREPTMSRTRARTEPAGAPALPAQGEAPVRAPSRPGSS